MMTRLLVSVTLLLISFFAASILAYAGRSPDGCAHHSMRRALSSKDVNTSWLGVIVEDSQGPASSPAFKTGRRVVVVDVVKGSPAEDAGIIKGDVLVKADGKDVAFSNDLFNILKGYTPGSDLALVVDKDGRLENVYVRFKGVPYGGTAIYGFEEPSMHPGQAQCRSCPAMGYHSTVMKHCQNYAKIKYRVVQSLDLTDAQRKKIESIWNNYEKRVLRLSSDLEVGEIELNEMLSDEPVNLERVKAKLGDIGVKMSDEAFSEIKVFEEIKRALTPEQRGRLRDYGSGQAEMSGCLDHMMDE